MEILPVKRSGMLTFAGVRDQPACPASPRSPCANADEFE